MKFPAIKEMAEEVAEKALDEFEYKGKTLRQWIEIISAIPVTAIPDTDTNVGAELSTNLAEVGTDCISRQDALDIYDDYNIAVENGEIEAYGRFRKQLAQLPPIQPKRGEVDRHRQ